MATFTRIINWTLFCNTLETKPILCLYRFQFVGQESGYIPLTRFSVKIGKPTLWRMILSHFVNVNSPLLQSTILWNLQSITFIFRRNIMVCQFMQGALVPCLPFLVQLLNKLKITVVIMKFKLSIPSSQRYINKLLTLIIVSEYTRETVSIPIQNKSLEWMPLENHQIPLNV